MRSELKKGDKTSRNLRNLFLSAERYIGNQLRKEYLWIFILLILSFIVSYSSSISNYSQSDPLGALLVSQSILEHGTVVLDAYSEEVLNDYKWQLTKRNGRTFYGYPLGTSIYALPFVWLANVFHMDMKKRNHEVRLQRRLASLTVAIALLLIYLMARCYFCPVISGLLSVVLVFGSSILSTMGLALWNMNLTVVFILLSLLLLIYDKKGKRKLNPYLIGFFLFSAFFCRPTAAIFISCVYIYLFIRDRIVFMKAAVTFFAFFLGLLAYSLSVYKFIYPGEFGFSIHEYSKFDWVACYGYLFSPNRGLLIYSPFLVITFSGVFVFFKKLYKNLLFWTALAAFVFHFLFLCAWAMWYGGGSFGYRLLTDSYPNLVFLTLLVLQCILAIKTQIWRWISVSFFTLLSLFSIFIHTHQGLYNPYTERWNWLVSKNKTEDLLFNWRYPQLLASEESLIKREAFVKLRSFDRVYFIGETIFPENDNAVFDSWYAVDGTEDSPFRWSAFNSARVWINIKVNDPLQPDFPLLLEVKVSTYMGQTIEVLVNNSSIGFIKTDKAISPSVFTFPFKAGALGSPDSNFVYHTSIEFLIPGALIPAKIEPKTNPNDKRTIGIRLYELKIKSQ